jgi:HD-GYP domain-containing protein (c-di-GMP phosphodiesterase class II)
MQLLGMGALIHDIEHFHSGLDVSRPIKSMSKDELALYKDHPNLGGKRFQDKKHIDQQVMNIIVQHEEFIDGGGFPKGLRESQMDPLAVLVAGANAVDRLITFESVPRATAGKELMIRNVGKYPLEQMKHLTAITSQAMK